MLKVSSGLGELVGHVLPSGRILMSNFTSFTTVTFTIVNRERGEPDQTISHESCNKSSLSAIISGSTTSSQQAFPSSEKIEQSCNRDETCATPRIKLFHCGRSKSPTRNTSSGQKLVEMPARQLSSLKDSLAKQ